MKTAPAGLRANAASPPDAVLVIDDHPLVRLGVEIWVGTLAGSGHGAIRLLEAASLEEGLSAYRSEGALIGLVLMDLHLPDAHGSTGIQSFMREFPLARVAILSASSDPALIQQVKRLGAIAYIHKGNGFDAFDQCIRDLGLWQPTAMAASAGAIGVAADIERARVISLKDGASVALTSRQSEILDWVLTGLSNREIAERVFLSEGTVKNHVSSLLLLFGTRSRANLISLLR